MKIKIEKISDDEFKEYRKIKTLEELLNIRKEFKCSVIVQEFTLDDCDLGVIIYDGYL